MVALAANTFHLLLSGLRALALQRVDLPNLRALGPAVIIIALLSLLSDGVVEWSMSSDAPWFVAMGLATKLSTIALLVGGLLLIGTSRRGIEIAALVAVIMALNVWINVAVGITITASRLATSTGGDDAEHYTSMTIAIASLGALVWFIGSLAVLGWRATPTAPFRFGIGLVATGMASVFLLPQTPVMMSYDEGDRSSQGLVSLAYQALKPRPVRSANAAPRPPQIDVEATFARQPELLDKALDTLKPSRSDRPEVYFVGMAPYSGQDVFKREINSAQTIVNERLDAFGRSVVMMNHRDTLETHALANATNLERILWRIAQLMDREKDILVLYITTHGSEGQLSVSFPRFSMNDLTPEKLASIIARTGIKNRVVMISACHSGSFLPALTHPDSVVMAAARADRLSFGCSNERDWTYFGDALFNHALRDTRSLTDAFERAKATVTKWETDQKLSPASEPQIAIGENIAPKLAALAHGLEHGFAIKRADNTPAPK